MIIVARDYSEECGLKTVHGCASPYERTTPYFVWRSIFFDIFELDLPHLLHQDARRAHVLSRLQQDPMVSKKNLLFLPLFFFFIFQSDSTCVI